MAKLNSLNHLLPGPDLNQIAHIIIWEHLPIALHPDEHGMIFSDSVDGGLVIFTEHIFPAEQDQGLELFTEGGTVLLNSLDIFHFNPATFQIKEGPS